MFILLVFGRRLFYLSAAETLALVAVSGVVIFIKVTINLRFMNVSWVMNYDVTTE